MADAVEAIVDDCIADAAELHRARRELVEGYARERVPDKAVQRRVRLDHARVRARAQVHDVEARHVELTRDCHLREPLQGTHTGARSGG